MTGKKDFLKSVNANENLETSWLRDQSIVKPGYTQYIEFANLAIKRHCLDAWKNLPSHPRYQYAQAGICMSLNIPFKKIETALSAIAIELGRPELVLFNDELLKAELLKIKYFSSSSQTGIDAD